MVKQKISCMKWLLCLGIIGFLKINAFGESLIHKEEWEKKVTVKTLENGLTIVLIERHEAPTFSAFLRVNVGAVQEQVGQSGLAHMFEHMAFKGSDHVGTNNFEKEQIALAKVEVAYQAYRDESRKEVGKDESKVKQLEIAWKKAMDEAEPFVNRGEYLKIVSKAGGLGLNAFTNHAETGYMVSFPINRLELWAYLESERMKKPVMREFYQERKIVWEERRTRTESNPIGRLIEQFYAAAFTAHPYGRPVVGWPADLDSISATDAQNFWETYYTPSNMVLAIVGDIHIAETIPLLEAYFGRLPKKPKPTFVPTKEPTQHVERMVMMRETAEPIYVEGYHRGNFRDKDDPVYSVLSEILDGGRSSRLYRSLVRDLKLASGAGSDACSPYAVYPCLFIFSVRPLTSHSAQEVRKALHDQINRLKTELVSEEELKAAKTRFQVETIDAFKSNMSLARIFGTAQQIYRDWHQLFDDIEKLDKVSAEDIRRVAKSTFVDENRTSAWIEKVATDANPQKKISQKGGQP